MTLHRFTTEMKKKNFLNQKNESEKGKDFKRRKAALGRGLSLIHI